MASPHWYGPTVEQQVQVWYNGVRIKSWELGSALGAKLAFGGDRRWS